VIQDSEGGMFGAYCSDGLSTHNSFFGFSDSLVFKFKNPSSPPIPFTASQMNNHYVWCSNMSGIGFGSTEEGYALYISPTLSTGHSYPSLTFNNS